MNNYQNQYREQSIYSMTKGEQLLLLFDEAIKKLKQAEILLDEGDIPLFRECVQKTMDINRYLISILDRKNYEIGNELFRIYDFLGYQLSRVKASKSKAVLLETIPFYVNLRNTFAEADRIANEEQAALAK